MSPKFRMYKRYFLDGHPVFMTEEQFDGLKELVESDTEEEVIRMIDEGCPNC